VTFDLKQFGLLPEGFHQAGPAAHPPQGFSGSLRQLKEVFRAEVGQLVLLAVPPNVFDRVKLRRVSRQVLHMDLPLLARDKLAYRSTAVHRQSIPDNQQLGGDVSLEVLQELNDLLRLNRSREQSEVEAPDRNASYRRKALPVERILQNRRLPPWRPGPDTVGPLTQAALVHKHYGAVLLEGFFFNSGQRTRFHPRIAGSSRWVARPAGRWQLQPNERKIRHTCPG